MEGLRTGKSRMGTLSKKACVGCRRLKMKCVWTEGQPCMRCQKTKRRCVFATPSSQLTTASTSEHAQTDTQAQAQAAMYETPDLDGTLGNPFTSTAYVNDASHPGDSIGRPTWKLVPVPTAQSLEPPAQDQGDLYPPSTSLPTVPLNNIALWAHPAYHAPKPTVGSPPQSPSCFSDTPVPGPVRNYLPTDEEMSHLCQFFVANLLVHIPILTEQDVGDFWTMVKGKKRVLACAMVYVAARYVPGCKMIQRMLLPNILAILKPLPHDCDQETRWTTLQALAVLYNWAVPSDLVLPTEPDGSDAILLEDALRVSMEINARQCSLHRAAEELAIISEQHHNDLDVRQTAAFRKYLVWLWLFGVAHFRSLWARSPPSMLPDSSIRSCTRLLQGHFHDHQVRRIVAQVELCLIWTQPTCREWWCSMPTQSESDLETTLAVLKDMDEALERWRRTWVPADQARSNQSQSLDFQYYFSRFCISAYVTRLHQPSASARTPPLLTLSLITKSIERASQSSRLLLELRPLSKSIVRFGPEDTFAMVALGCHYVLSAHRLLVDLDIVKPGHLRIVRSMAELMVELGIDGKHSARIYGESLLGSFPSQLDATHSNTPSWHLSPSHPPGLQSPEAERTVSANSKVWASSTSVNPSLLGSRQLFDLMAAVDQVWPLSSMSLRDEHTPPQRTALWATGERSIAASQHGHQPMVIAPSPNSGVIGLGFNYNGSESLVYTPGGERMGYTT